MVEVRDSEERAAAVSPPPVPAIVWEDEHLLVVDKPAGLVVHPGAGHAGDTLVDALPAGSPAATRSGRGSSTASTATPRG